MAAAHFPRSADERMLDWLARRSRGELPAQIARLWQTTAGTVRSMTRRVRDADVAESGEDVRTVMAGYW